MARNRRSSRKSNKLLFEAGIAIILILVAYITLSAISMQVKTEIISTSSLPDDTIVKFTFEEFNLTAQTCRHIHAFYNLSDIATISDGYLYISIPWPSLDPGYEVMTLHYIDIRPSKGDGTYWKWKELAEKGVN